jgi:zinc transport system substrate-binding protein
VEPAAGTGTPRLGVAVTVLPQRTFVERIAGARVQVQVLLPPGANHELYEPGISSLEPLGRCLLWLQVAPELFPFEQAWADKIRAVAPRMRLVDTSAGAARRGDNPHLWLSPRSVRVQARTIARALGEVDPGGQAAYAAGLARFEQELDGLERELSGLLAPLRGKRFVTFHPSWEPFAREYGFELQAIQQEGREPGPHHLDEVILQARAAGARDVFVEPFISSRSASTVAEALGGQMVVLDPLAPDWDENLRRAARAFLEHAR